MRAALIAIAFCISSLGANPGAASAAPVGKVQPSSVIEACPGSARLLLHAAYRAISTRRDAGCAAPLSTDTLMRVRHWART
jgi:hypothetical protein